MKQEFFSLITGDNHQGLIACKNGTSKPIRSNPCGSANSNINIYKEDTTCLSQLA